MGNRHSSSRASREWGSSQRRAGGANAPSNSTYNGVSPSNHTQVAADNAASATGPNPSLPSNMPAHLANQYSNNVRQNRSNGPAAAASTPPPHTGASPSSNPATTTTPQPASLNTHANPGNSSGVQEGQMVKMLATIEATTVHYNPAAQLLTFYITSTCPSLTYEIHTGVKEFVMGGKVFYMPNKPKMEPTRTLVEGPRENRKVTVKLDINRLDEKEKIFNKHYPKQMPCVVVLRYRTTEFRKKEEIGGGARTSSTAANCSSNNNDDGEEVVVEHTEHTAVDLAERPKRRVISQIVTTSGNAYVVENLYGADNENAGGCGEGMEVMVGSTIVPHEGEEDDDGLCVICLTNPKDTAVMPCRHMCMCKECGEQLLKHKPVCPVCRAPISTLLHMPTITSDVVNK